MVSKEKGIGVVGCECMEQSVLVITSRKLFELIFGNSESSVDVSVDEVVENLKMLVELFTWVEERQTASED